MMYEIGIAQLVLIVSSDGKGTTFIVQKAPLGAPAALRTPTPHDGKILNYIHILTNTSYYHPSLIKA